MPVYDESVNDTLNFIHSVTSQKVIIIEVITPFYTFQQCAVYTQAIDPIYGTLTGAENYFRGMIKSTVTEWTDADSDDRMAALRRATQIMETLNFKGTPVSDDQILHFPTNEHGTPDGINKACYMIALRLLEGINPDTEADNLSVTLQGYAGGQTRYDRQFVQEHIRAGVPSANAWLILRPYLCDPNAIRVSRG